MEEDIELAIKSLIMLITGESFKTLEQFNGYTPAYPFNTEDSSALFKVYEPYIKNQNVLTVTGSGDAVLDLILRGASKITCFDINKNAKYYAKLKLAAAKSKLPYEEFVSFFYNEEYGSEILNYETYLKIRHNLDENGRYVWDKVYTYLIDNGIKILNSKASLVYPAFDSLFHFPTVNSTIRNENSYISEKNYIVLLKVIDDIDLNNIIFVDSALFSLDEKVGSEKFSMAFFSNIMEFTSLFINENDLDSRLQIFADFISQTASKWINKNGVIIVSYLKKSRTISKDICLYDEDYLKMFREENDFYYLDLRPYNNRDTAIVFCNKKLGKELKYHHDPYDFY